jgi:hypothetical protein
MRNLVIYDDRLSYRIFFSPSQSADLDSITSLRSLRAQHLVVAGTRFHSGIKSSSSVVAHFVTHLGGCSPARVLFIYLFLGSPSASDDLYIFFFLFCAY